MFSYNLVVSMVFSCKLVENSTLGGFTSNPGGQIGRVQEKVKNEIASRQPFATQEDVQVVPRKRAGWRVLFTLVTRARTYRFAGPSNLGCSIRKV
jgi:hypothetical protein